MQIIDGPVFTAGTSVSNVVSLGNYSPYIILTPAAWTAPANLMALYSPDSTNFYPLFVDNKLWEVMCPAGAAVMIVSSRWPKGSFLRFVSSFVGNPVIQTATRNFKILADTQSMTSFDADEERER
jgi:hypothetical protein